MRILFISNDPKSNSKVMFLKQDVSLERLAYEFLRFSRNNDYCPEDLESIFLKEFQDLIDSYCFLNDISKAKTINNILLIYNNNNNFLVFDNSKIIGYLSDFFTNDNFNKIFTNKNIILNGKGGSGKDLFADYLVKHYGYKKVAFGEIIYDEAYKRGMKKKDRELLQNIGLEFRKKGKDYISKALNKKINKLSSQYDKFIITDCRDQYEYQYFVNNKDFIPVRILADENIRARRIFNRDGVIVDKKEWFLLNNHPLENLLNDFFFIDFYNNTDNLEDLFIKIDSFMNAL